jgi:hypothetical protein
MALTTEQKATVKANILATPELLSLINDPGEGASSVAAWYNLMASPAFVVWKTDVSIDEIMRNGMDWARVDNLTVGKARIWDWLGRLGTFDASKPNVRAGIDAAWVGTAADLAVRASVYTHCKRDATRIEKLLSVGTGTTVSPATMTLENQISYIDILSAMEQ